MSSYATPADFYRFGCPASAVASIPAGDVQAELDAKSTLADGYLAKRYTLPLLGWGTDLTSAVCQMACCALLETRGIQPDSDGGEIINRRYERALKWLEGVRDGDIIPMSIVEPSSVSSTEEYEVYLTSDSSRGW